MGETVYVFYKILQILLLNITLDKIALSMSNDY